MQQNFHFGCLHIYVDTNAFLNKNISFSHNKLFSYFGAGLSPTPQAFPPLGMPLHA